MTGGTGTGKTLLGLQFLVAGAREYGEPGVLLTFEESTAKVTANVASLGFDLDALQRDQLLIADAFRVDASEFGEAGEFDFEPLFILSTRHSLVCCRTSSPRIGPSWSDSTCANRTRWPMPKRTNRPWPNGAGPIQPFPRNEGDDGLTPHCWC